MGGWAKGLSGHVCEKLKIFLTTSLRENEINTIFKGVGGQTSGQNIFPWFFDYHVQH